MSGTLSNVHSNVSFALRQHANAMFVLQEQAYTGSQVNRLSDDPSAGYQILTLSSHERSLANYIDRINESMEILGASSVAIKGMSDTVTDAKVLMTQIVSGTYDEAGRTRMAEQIDSYLEHIVSLANMQHSGTYTFGGGDTASAPYNVTRTNGEITDVTYQGSSINRQVEVAPGVDATTYYAGDSLFQSDNRSAPVFIGSTGAAVGSGTSNIKGDAWLTVTKVGADYKLSIDDGASTVTVPLGGDSNTAVTDATGRVLYVDTTNLNSVGVEMVNVAGTYSVFDALISARDLLKNTRSLSDSQLKSARDSLTASLDEAKELLTGKLTTIGSQIGFSEDLKGSIINMQFDTEDQISSLQEADIAQIAIDISRRQVLYEMSLSMAARLMSMSLLDFIR
jgi:flagellar hook-associated protein 3 FlgL